jgi:hypothetical protein
MRSTTVFAITFLFLLLPAGCSRPQGGNSITLHNESLYVIDQFFLISSGTIDDGYNYLEAPLPPGEMFTVENVGDGAYILKIRYLIASETNRQHAWERKTFTGEAHYHWWFYLGKDNTPVSRIETRFWDELETFLLNILRDLNLSTLFKENRL